MTTIGPASFDSSEPWVTVTASSGLAELLSHLQISLAFTTYQAGKLFFLGVNCEQQLSVFERTFNRCMGLWGDGQTLWMSSLYQLWRFENVLRPGQAYDGHDCLYVPRCGYTTGDLDMHDISVGHDGRPIFVNTRFGCLATLSDRDSFRPLWQPPRLDRLAAEDCCHLNGVALSDGQPAFVTMASLSDVPDGWREHRRDGGCVMQVANGQVVTGGLSMPHSPRIYRDNLYVLNSGAGEFGRINLRAGQFEPLTFCPGFLRGLAFRGDFAVVGLSRPRHEATFAGLALEGSLEKAGLEARCGLAVIDLRSNRIVEWVWLEGDVRELYDVVTLPDVRRPMAFGFVTDEIQRIVTADVESAPLARDTTGGLR